MIPGALYLYRFPLLGGSAVVTVERVYRNGDAVVRNDGPEWTSRFLVQPADLLPIGI